MFFNEKNNFSFHDFSQSTYEKFEECFKIFEKLQEDNNDEEKDKLNTCLIASMPFIQIEVWLEYDKEKDSLINISEFISDLDDKLNIVKIKLKYKSKDSKKIFSLFEVRKDKSQKLIEWLNENITSFYDIKCYGGDNLIEDNLKRKLFSVLCFENIQASRKLDDTKNDRNRTLAVGFSDYYREMNKENNQDIDTLKNQLKLTSEDLKKKYSDILKTLLQKLKSFGVEPYLTIPEINIEANFDPENILKNNIRYFYKQNDINLPENYNGLGYSNLIYLVLKVVSFIEKFKKIESPNISETLTILIEEPEAHLHPQMQQVFISQIQQTIKDARETDNLAVQVIISTHSSHIINEAGINIDRSFKRIRYFLKLNDKTRERVAIKDFNEFRKEDDNNDETFRFLKQYMTLNKCDIFFADKLILVEGSTERILLPLMINKVAEKLNNEYVSIIEVGGSYTVKFKELLKFINTKSLIITDIDSVIGVEKKNKKGKKQIIKKTCPTAKSDSETCNYTLKNWLPKKTSISDLIACDEKDKFDSELIRVAYQIKEESSDYVARSLEEAILNANKSFFIQHKDKFELKKKLCNDLEYNPYKLAPVKSEKINFTFKLMTNEEQWKVPKYIEEGLIWLSKNENNK